MQAGQAAQNKRRQVAVPATPRGAVMFFVDPDVTGPVEKAFQTHHGLGPGQRGTRATVYATAERDVGPHIHPVDVEYVRVGNFRGSRLSAALISINVVPAGRSTPPTFTGTFDNRKSPRTGLS